MKRILALVLALLLILPFCACGDTENKENETAQIPAETSKYDTALGSEASSEAADIQDPEQDETVIVKGSYILVQSGDTLEKPYKSFIWATNWVGSGWVSADGLSISDKFQDVYSEIPEINYCEDFAIHYEEGVELISLSVYNSNFQILDRNATLKRLATLADGTYYLVVTVKARGRYIEEEEKYEYAGYECVYKLVVADEASD